MSSENREEVIRELQQIARNFHEQFSEGDVPSLSIPYRTKNNIEYDEDMKVWRLGNRKKTQSAKSASGATSLNRKMRVIEYLLNQVEENRSSTLREMYYVSEGWGKYGQFESQDQSNNALEDLEVATGKTREDFNMRPEESGATLLGPLEIREETRRGERMIHCQNDVGEGGYQIPSNPETVHLENHDADFVLAVETGGMRDRLVENGFDEEFNAIIVHLKGQPSRSTRRITKRLRSELNLPVAVFTDSDPWSYRIFGSVSYGSIKSAHLSEFLATPDAMYLGLRPQDIQDFDLPTDPLEDSDINALESIMTDPRFQSDYWKEQIQLQLDIGKKAEQQSLASRGLDFVTEEYLPTRLREMDVID